MKTKPIALLALGIALLAVCGPLFAHHGSAAYDDGKATVLKNVTVTKVNWGNPHTLLLFDAKDDKGNDPIVFQPCHSCRTTLRSELLMWSPPLL